MLVSICLCRAGWKLGGLRVGGQGLISHPSSSVLPQVPSWAMDMNVLMSAQLLMEQVAAEGGGTLLYLLYQHLLFNFHLWTLSNFAVRLGRCGDLGKGLPPGRMLVEVLRSYSPVGDLRGHICPEASEGTMTLSWWGVEVGREVWQGHGPYLGGWKGPGSVR